MEGERLYQGLKDLGLLYDSAAAALYGTSMEYYGGPLRRTEWFRALPEALRLRYGFCVSLNGMKFSLAAKCFHKPCGGEALSAAVCFILAGCILDHMLDEGSPEEQAAAREKLTWEYCAQYFIRHAPLRTDHPVDRLYHEIASFLREKKETAAGSRLLDDLRRAAQAELRASCVLGAPEDAAMTAEKSVLFTVIGFELALYGEHTSEEWEAFFLIGDIFRLIDDLCDAEQDRLAGRANSLLADAGADSGAWIEDALSALRQAMARLERVVNEPFFAFLRYEVQSWTLGNARLYQKMLEVPPCRM